MCFKGYVLNSEKINVNEEINVNANETGGTNETNETNGTNVTNDVFQLKDVCFAYPGSGDTLKNINLSVRKGERIVLLGANGCGKSTLLKILSALAFVKSGEFLAFGEKIEQKRFGERAAMLYHKRIGFIFQDSEVQLFCTTVFEELAFGLLQLGFSREETKKRIEEIALLLGIDKLLQKTPFHLSGGEKKKVAIASIILMNPDVLLLDEPTNSLDPRTQSWLLKVLKSLSEEGKTLIFATHNLEILHHICDRVVLFSEEHTIVRDTGVDEALQDAELLRKVNLVDEHYHYHDFKERHHSALEDE